MTKKTRIEFSLTDLATVRLECRNCQGEIVQRFEGRHWKIPTSCPLCMTSWDERDSRRKELDDLILKMRVMTDDPDPRVNLKFEMDCTVEEE